MSNRINHKMPEVPVSNADRERMKQINHNKGLVCQAAATINHLLSPGATILVEIKSGRILVPGQVSTLAGFLVISKPAFVEQLAVQVDPSAVSAKPPASPEKN